jgi:hypothetical protein
MKRRSRKITRGMNMVGPMAQHFVIHTGRKGRPPKKVLTGEAFEEIKRLERKYVKRLQIE